MIMSSATTHGIDDDNDPPYEEASRTEEVIRKNLRDGPGGIAIAVCGYHGAGKTEAAEAIYERADEQTGDVVIKHVTVEDELESATDSSEVKNLALRQPRLVASEVSRRNNFADIDVAIIDGAASFEELILYSQYFSQLKIIFIEAHGLARHSRLIETPSEDEHDRNELIEADRELAERGLKKMEETFFYDQKIENVELDKSEFRSFSKYIASSILNDFNL
jgi:dephospho-CoA kinase